MTPDQYAEYLRSRRERASMTREQLAAAIGVTPQCVRDWERAKRKPWPRNEKLIDDLLDAHEQQLIRKVLTAMPVEAAMSCIMDCLNDQAARVHVTRRTR